MSAFTYNQSVQEAATSKALKQCVESLQQTLFLTPLGWGLVVWLCHEHIPLRNISVWVLIFFAEWLVAHGVILYIKSASLSNKKITLLLNLICATDGLAWGAIVPFLFLYNQLIDSWLVVVLCGVAAINAPVYVTCMSAFRFFAAGLWLLAVPPALGWGAEVFAASEFSIGFTIYLFILHYNINILSNKIILGIKLQLENDNFAKDLAESLKQVETLANNDALTNLANRRSLNAMLAHLQQKKDHEQESSCLIMFDIDFFKKINDVYGHAIGDKVLFCFGQRVQSRLRSSDVLSRYGGEEFIAILPGADLKTALEIAERIRMDIEHHELLADPPISITVSLGVSVFEQNESIDDLINKVDACLYRAKNNGRNQVWFNINGTEHQHQPSLQV
ncbi:MULTISPECIES: GGDEF domain-containing protein [Aquitalea]|uniref:diguanylate cyclase n=1 Tax=Aquitalea magnusonii TaxID=332411 RepID=A0A318JIT1_9NEIS|nr:MULTISPECIES: GGDEF domain-containing protein [Aquitalea]PXX50952.1 diguanylate cyclase (GGDEF)-like protein [Aquitalea magnusonii]